MVRLIYSARSYFLFVFLDTLLLLLNCCVPTQPDVGEMLSTLPAIETTTAEVQQTTSSQFIESSTEVSIVTTSSSEETTTNSVMTMTTQSLTTTFLQLTTTPLTTSTSSDGIIYVWKTFKIKFQIFADSCAMCTVPPSQGLSVDFWAMNCFFNPNGRCYIISQFLRH